MITEQELIALLQTRKEAFSKEVLRRRSAAERDKEAAIKRHGVCQAVLGGLESNSFSLAALPLLYEVAEQIKAEMKPEVVL